MQCKLMAAVLAAAIPLCASAQSSVTIYGVADAALAKEDTGAKDGRRTVVNSGNQSTSRIGFRGVEDLGNGLSAVFNLEAGVAIDSGKQDESLFGRRSVVGVKGGFGTVLLGREYTPIADVAGASDINGQGFYGSNLNSFGSDRLTRRISNSVNYKSNSMGGVVISAAYGLGETPAHEASKDLMGLAVEYKANNIYVGAGYHQIERLLSGDDREMIFGAGFTFGAFDIRGNYMVANPTGNNNTYKQANAGVSYTFGSNKIYTNLQQSKLDNGAKGNGFSLAYSYALSKRTNVYASYATIRNNDKAVFGINAAGANVTPPVTAFGSDPSAFSVGVRHAF
ncbi:porin [Massilia antarctica]|uniref:porin n=1 Tax=Massilia antarctica TaxID=2765360 RepID=UPI0006BB7284|nr:porin [Massilia sp. H27-R4]MCY0914654.1 porin [Massilia sp. H27-R4]CUI08317.1 Outer membrane protein (porin) [Janthinobacterium sp. CG23_2]CUU32103.1 Outer membrane protein (porin) [Janthinobacterium sp. CG23_2]